MSNSVQGLGFWVLFQTLQYSDTKSTDPQSLKKQPFTDSPPHPPYPSFQPLRHPLWHPPYGFPHDTPHAIPHSNPHGIPDGIPYGLPSAQALPRVGAAGAQWELRQPRVGPTLPRPPHLRLL